MTNAQDAGGVSSALAAPRWYVLGPLAALSVVAFAVGGLWIFGMEFGWSDGGRPPARLRLDALILPTVIAIAPALTLLLLAVVRPRPASRRTRRSVIGAVVAGLILTLALLTIGQYVAGVAAQAIRDAHLETLPLTPNETAYTVETATIRATEERDAALAALGFHSEYDHVSETSCRLSTGTSGVELLAGASERLSTSAETTGASGSATLAQHWEDRGYDVEVTTRDDGSVVVRATADDGFTAHGAWFVERRRFELDVRSVCLRP